MTQGTLAEILQKHGIETRKSGNLVIVREDYTTNGTPGHEYKTMDPEEWTLKSLLLYLGY